MSEATLIISGEGEQADVRRVPIFAVPVRRPNPEFIDGSVGGVPESYDESTPEFIDELVTYDMPAEVNPVIGLEYGERSGENAAAASVWIIKEMLGEPGYRALVAEMKKMSPAKATQVLEQVSTKIGAVALGN